MESNEKIDISRLVKLVIRDTEAKATIVRFDYRHASFEWQCPSCRFHWYNEDALLPAKFCGRCGQRVRF